MEAHEPIPVEAERDHRDLFPFPQARGGQGQFLEDARSCMSNRVDLVADAPTGLGKTAVGLTASLEAVLPSQGAVLFLTSRQSQHRAAIETVRYIWRRERVKVVDLISREDMCLCRGRDGQVPCTGSGDCYFLDRERVEAAAARLLEYPLHVGEAMRLCVRMGGCPYLAARAALAKADLVVGDYHHAFSGGDQPVLEGLGRPTSSSILVVDEAHNLPSRIIEAHSRSLARSQLCSALKGTGNRHFREALTAILAFLDRHAFGASAGPLAIEALDDELEDAVGSNSGELAQGILDYYQGRPRRHMEELALFLQGCAGDINPVQYKDVHNPRDAEPLGNLLGLSAMRALKRIQSKEDGPLKILNETLALPRATDMEQRIAALQAEQTNLLQSLKGTSLNLKTFLPLYVQYKLSAEFPSYYSHRYLHDQAIGREDMAKLDAENRANMEAYVNNIQIMEQLTRVQVNLDLLKMHHAQNVAAGKNTIDVEVVGLRIGDFVLVTFPGELSVQIGLNIKQHAPAEFTFVAGYTNGYIYYTPTAEQRNNTGHAQEDCDCLVAPEWQKLFEERAAEILKKL